VVETAVLGAVINPASMMMAEMGGILKVMGRRIEMVATGPIPGRTPMRVPGEPPGSSKRGSWAGGGLKTQEDQVQQVHHPILKNPAGN